MTKFVEQEANTELIEPSALAGHYLRTFSRAVASMEDFQAFIESLKLVVGDDPFLEAEAVLSDPSDDCASSLVMPDFNALEDTETVVPVVGGGGHMGYMKLRGRRDSQPFGAEDLHLMGAIAGFISALTLQARKFRQSAQAEKVLRYLVNQLPLGVVCLNNEHELIVESNLAAKTLGETGRESLLELLQNKDAFVAGRVQGHFEAEGRLVYTEGRRLKVDSGLEVTAFVLYDLSDYREKFFTELELEAYRTHSRGRRLTLALLRRESGPGEGYIEMMAAAEKIQQNGMQLRPLDAYTTACIFAGQGLRSARSILASMLGAAEDPLELALLPVEGPFDETGAADSFIDRALESLLVAREALLPELIVLDPYPAVHEALGMITADVCQVHGACAFEEAVTQIRSGRFDGLVIDIDCFQDAQILALKHEAAGIIEDFKIFFCSCHQTEMVRQREGVGPEAIVLCKPFQAQEVMEKVSRQFNLA